MSIENFEIISGTDPRTLSEGVVGRLRAEILDGTFEAGQKLAMSDLTRRYGVGLSPIREALSRLAGEGLVKSEGQRGFRVAEMSEEDFDEITALRQMVEEEGVRAAVAKGDDQWEASLVAAFHLLERRATALEKDTSAALMDAYESAHKAFHVAIVAGAKSKRLAQMQLRLYEEARRYRLLFYREYVTAARFDGQRVIAVHRPILDALLARDADGAAHLLREHVALLRTHQPGQD